MAARQVLISKLQKQTRPVASEYMYENDET
jgi:hypothetical protein